MSEGMYILVRFVGIFLDVIMVAMLARAILSWFTFSEGANQLGSFLYMLTEPLILPLFRMGPIRSAVSFSSVSM